MIVLPCFPSCIVRLVSARKLIFSGIGQRDVYNIAAPFDLDGTRVIAGRVESRDVEHSEIVFFTTAGGTWQPVPSARTFPGLQDPCITSIGGEIILGGVRFPVTVTDGTIGWRMEFYRGNSIDNLKLFLVGPDKMKDIRLVELVDGQIGVLTRPQGTKGGRGKIGFLTLPSLEVITAEAIQEAPLFEGQCREDEWVGANEAHRLQNGMIGVLGHIAYFDDKEHRHYYAMVFVLIRSMAGQDRRRLSPAVRIFPMAPPNARTLWMLCLAGAGSPW